MGEEVSIRDITLGQKVKHIRLNLGLSQRRFAQAIGVSEQTVYYWERGRFEPSSSAIGRILKVFKITPRLIYPEQEPEQ